MELKGGKGALDSVVEQSRSEAPMDSHSPHQWHGTEEKASQVGADQVLVLGGNDEEILRHVRAIEQASRAGGSRGFNGDEGAFRGKGSRDGVLQCLARRQARPVLWKVFRSGTNCNLMSEIWIEDKASQDAKKDPCKEYVIVHVHHHKTVRSQQELQNLLKPSEWSNKRNLSVDAVNARHLLPPGTPVCNVHQQLDNPFFERRGHTYHSSAIEHSDGSSLKLFPDLQRTWACACSHRNFRLKCRGQQKHSRPCDAWDWESDSKRDQGLATLFRLAHAAADAWLGGGAKNRVRGEGGDAEGCFRTLADVQNLQSQVRVETTALGLFVGIDKYKNMQWLCHCRKDAKAMCRGMQKAAGGAALCTGLTEGELGDGSPIGFMYLQEQVDIFWQNAMPQPPKILLFYFAGHGIHESGNDHVLASDFKRGTSRIFGAWEVQDLVKSLCPPELNDTEKFFILDCCRTASPGDRAWSRPHLSSDFFQPLNTVVVFPTKAGYTADDGSVDDAHGPFCQELLGDESHGLFSSGASFSARLSKACTRYDKKRYQKGMQRSDPLGSTESEVRLEDLRAQAEESLHQARSGDMSRCPKLTMQASMEGEAMLEAVDVGQPFIRLTSRAQQMVTISSEHSSEYEKDTQDVDWPESEPSELERMKLYNFASDSDLSAASTCSESSSSFEDDDEEEILVTSSAAFREAKQALLKLESVVAQWIDEVLDDLWVDLEGPLGLQGQQELLDHVEQLVSQQLRESGVQCDPRMSRKLEEHVLRDLARDKKDKLAQKSLLLCKEKADLLLRVQERARRTYFRVRYMAETGSFTASLKAPKWVVVLLDILLLKYEDFRSTVLKLGFHKFQLSGVKIVLSSTLTDELGADQARVEARRYDVRAKKRVVTRDWGQWAISFLGDRVTATDSSPNDQKRRYKGSLPDLCFRENRYYVKPWEKVSGLNKGCLPDWRFKENRYYVEPWVRYYVEPWVKKVLEECFLVALYLYRALLHFVVCCSVPVVVLVAIGGAVVVLVAILDAISGLISGLISGYHVSVT